MEYNGWTNYETWKLGLEFVNSVNTEDMFEMLGYEMGDAKPEAYEVGERLKAHTMDYLEMGERDPFALEWARVALEQVNYRELAEHLCEDIEETEYFKKEGA